MSDDEERVWLTPREEAIVTKTVDRAISQMFLRLGIKINNDDDVLQMQRDLRWLRDVREHSQRAGRGAALAAVTLLVGAAIGSFWLGFQTFIRGGVPPAGP